jgi:virulence-associated protein VagC
LFTFAQNLLKIRQKGDKTMAKPIKETPILFGEDARRFEERMKEKRTESPEARERRLKIYEMLMATANF